MSDYTPTELRQMLAQNQQTCDEILTAASNFLPLLGEIVGEDDYEENVAALAEFEPELVYLAVSFLYRKCAKNMIEMDLIEQGGAMEDDDGASGD